MKIEAARQEVLAIIPARGGSKGLPRKNVLPLAGHPLIAYSIQAALHSTLITRVIVSSDDEEILTISRDYGADVPFVRPATLALDDSTDYEVFTHALDWLKNHEGYIPDLVVQLRPTSPVRTVEIIDHCIARLQQSDADSLRIVTPSPVTPYKMWRLEDENQPMIPLLTLPGMEEPFNQPRQKLPTIYWQIGFLDVIRTRTITKLKSMSGANILPCIVGSEFAVDIDDLGSFEKAAAVMNSDEKYVRIP
jgi:CMP-N,N'-diacetyllegionaminic acid synthase